MANILEFDYIYKIILIGDSGVGKTNIVTRFIQDKFIDDNRTTIGIDFQTRIYKIYGEQIKLQVWDTGGQERWRCITRSYYKQSGGIIIVFDLTRRETFDNISSWIKEIENNIDDTSESEILIIGNKSDLPDQRQVSTKDIEELKQRYNFTYIETSAKHDLNIDDAFTDLVMKVHKRGLYIYCSKDDKIGNLVIIRDDGVVNKAKCGCVIL